MCVLSVDEEAALCAESKTAARMDSQGQGTERALMIGNNNYEDGKVSSCGINDAYDVSKKLRMIGFQVAIGCNLTYLQPMELLIKFYADIQQNDLVIFFLSGHGVQWRDQNYLIYIDNQSFYVSVQIALDVFMARKPFATIMQLDCCRSTLPGHQHTKPDNDGTKLPKVVFNPMSLQ